MGKAQSKRSVDITTEVSKEGVAGEEGAGKVEKIEDVEKPQSNGDANHKEAEVSLFEKEGTIICWCFGIESIWFFLFIHIQGEEKGTAENENEKDKATEKDEQPAAEALPVENGAGEEASATEEKPTIELEKLTAESDNVNDTTAVSLNESKEVVEGGDGDAATPSTDKKKKEKSKKRFSFRSFSFSKKDKQKPKRSVGIATTNDECEKVLEEVIFFLTFAIVFSIAVLFCFAIIPRIILFHMKNSSNGIVGV